MDPSGDEIVRRIGARGPDAPAAEADLCRRFGQRIRAYGLRHLRDAAAADDLVQQVLVVTIESLRAGKLREPGRLASFVLSASRMVARGLRTGEARHHRLFEKYARRDEAVEPEPVLDADRLRACLEKLAPRERIVVVLTFFAERTGGEIAAELGTSAGNVRVLRHRALANLQTCMELEGEP